MQSPADTPFRIVPPTVQILGVVELNVTGSPLFVVALSVPLPPTARDVGFVEEKVMV
jgi:hypothetical protein